MYQILGHHHASMITKDAKKNNQFYTEILGLRRVKMTVNQDDPSMYHLFYGDRRGSPGTELTFFEMPLVGQTYRGTNAISRIGLLVPSSASLIFFKERFKSYGVKHGEITTYHNRKALHFEDPDHLPLVLLVEEDERLSGWEAWEHSEIPEEHQILGMGPIEIKVRRLKKLINTLTEVLNYTLVEKDDHQAVLQSVRDSVYGEIIVLQEEGDRERPGRGSIHHLAIRAKNDSEIYYWEKRIKERGFVATKVIDRHYFKSIYFRESNGIMFEIATDGPGFTIDSKLEDLGKQLDLPPFLEDSRKEIEAKLTPLEEL